MRKAKIDDYLKQIIDGQQIIADLISEQTKKITVSNNSKREKALAYLDPKNREKAKHMREKNPEIYDYITEILKLFFT